METNRENAGREGGVWSFSLSSAGSWAKCCVGLWEGWGHLSASLPVCGARSGDPGHNTSTLISFPRHVVPRKSRV